MLTLSLLLLCVSASSSFILSGLSPNSGSRQIFGSKHNFGFGQNSASFKQPSSFINPFQHIREWDFYVNGQRHRLVGTQNAKTWSSARLHCKSFNLDLAVIDSDYTNHEITRQLASLGAHATSGAWIGLTDIRKEGQFKDLCNGAPTYTAWDKYQPDNNYGSADCAVIKNVFGAGKWSDEVCTDLRPFICGPRAKCQPRTTTLSTRTKAGSQCEDQIFGCFFLFHCFNEKGRGYCAKTCSTCTTSHTTQSSFYSTNTLKPTFTTSKLTSQKATFSTNSKSTKTTKIFTTSKPTLPTTAQSTANPGATLPTTLSISSKQSTTKQSTIPTAPFTSRTTVTTTVSPTTTTSTTTVFPTTTTSTTIISPTTTTSTTTTTSPTTTISKTSAVTAIVPTTPACVDQLSTDRCEEAKKAVGCGKDMQLFCPLTCGSC